MFSIGYILNGRALAPFQLIQSATVIPFMLLGLEANKLKLPASKHFLLLVVSFVGYAVIYFLSQFDRSLNLVSNTLQLNPLILVSCGVVGTMSLVFLSMSVRGWISKFMVFFGLESMIIMGTHQELRVLSGYLIQSFVQPHPIVLLTLNLISIIVLSIPIIWFLNNYCPILVGKK